MDDQQIKAVLETAKTIAVIGCSDDPERPSNQVSKYLKEKGYKIIPVNPKYASVLGEKCYETLTQAIEDVSPLVIDIVDIFRKSEDVPLHVDDATAHGIKLVWMQEGIEHETAAAKARDKGVKVVMNRCLMKEHKRLMHFGV